MTLRQKIEKILLNYYGTMQKEEFREIILSEIMNEISKEVYGKPIHSMK